MAGLGCQGSHEEVSQGVGIVTPGVAAAMVGFHKPIALPDGLDRDAVIETFVRRPEAFMAGPHPPRTPHPDKPPLTPRGVDPALPPHRPAHHVHPTPPLRGAGPVPDCHGGGPDAR